MLLLSIGGGWAGAPHGLSSVERFPDGWSEGSCQIGWEGGGGAGGCVAGGVDRGGAG